MPRDSRPGKGLGIRLRLGAAALMVIAALGPVRAGAQQPVTAFVNVSVVSLDQERVLKGQTVVVQGDRIESDALFAELFEFPRQWFQAESPVHG